MVPAWTEYLYEEVPAAEVITREYVLQEQDQRTYLLCPRGYVIGQVSSTVLCTVNSTMYCALYCSEHEEKNDKKKNN